jgi:hypothetical protein
MQDDQPNFDATFAANQVDIIQNDKRKLSLQRTRTVTTRAAGAAVIVSRNECCGDGRQEKGRAHGSLPMLLHGAK